MASFEYEVERALESLDETKTAVANLFKKAQILGSAIDAITGDIPEFEPAEGAYGYIALDVADFIESLIDLDKVLRNDPDYKHSDLPYRPCSFLEVGCGAGRNLFVLKHAESFQFHKILGFDIAKEYIEHGKKLFRLSDELFVDDCLTYDYGGMDVIYFYRPFHEEEMETKFEQRLIDTAKRGAMVVAFSPTMLDESKQMMRVDEMGRIFKKL